MSSAFNFINMLNNLIKDKQKTEEIAGNTGVQHSGNKSAESTAFQTPVNNTSEILMEKTFYQKKFEDFKESLKFDWKLLEAEFKSHTFSNRLNDLQPSIEKILETNAHAKDNFTKAMQRTPRAIEDFCNIVLNGALEPALWDAEQRQKWADFIVRMSVDAPDSNNDNRLSPVNTLKNVAENLMKKLRAFLDNKGKTITDKERIRPLLIDFFESHELIDEKNKGKLALTLGFRLFLGNCLDKLEKKPIVQQNATTDYHNYAVNELCAFIPDNLNEETAIKILMADAPGSLWEVKCLQAGICEFTWVEKGDKK